MKTNIIFKGAMALTVVAGLASCSSDYLEREPITSVDETTVMADVSMARRTLYGICRAMYYGYDIGQNVQFMNGEGWINTMYGEVYGSDAYYTLWSDFGPEFMRGDYLRMNNYWMPQMPWGYAYNLIQQANKLLNRIDAAEGTQAERDFIKAQAKTFRAHAYVKLIQLYGPRWEDAKPADDLVCVLRLDGGTEDLPLSTMQAVLDQIKSDLDDAIALYESCGQQRIHIYEPDIQVAKGIYARIAMVTHDWATAQKMAHEAREGHEIMSNEQYLSGFNEANQEWIWANDNDPSDPYIGLYNWGALLACNGPYVAAWGYGAGAMNYDLWKQMDSKDIRRKLYWMPGVVSFRRPLSNNSYWNKDLVESSNMNMNTRNQQGGETLMATYLRTYANQMTPGGDASRFTGLAYRNKSVNPEDQLIGTVPFGAQFKFWGSGPYGNLQVPFMRGAEMAFIEAEAAYRLGDEATAISCIEEINKKRVEGYTCTKSGDDLLAEIQLSKRLEMWGEGFCWTDLKRWNLPMVRRAWKEGDPESNNIPEGFATTVTPDEHNGWRIILPNSEVNYNSLVQLYK